MAVKYSKEFKKWGEENVRLGLWSQEDYNALLAGTYQLKLTQEQEDKHAKELDEIVGLLRKKSHEVLKKFEK